MHAASLLLSILLISRSCDATSLASTPSPSSPSPHSSFSSAPVILAPRSLRSHFLEHPERRALTRSPAAVELLPKAERRSGPQPRTSLEQLSPKRFFDFLTDPSLLITVLHSLEVAYWTFPFGFVLTPVINFFRVPNRRSLDATSKSDRTRRSAIHAVQLAHLHRQLLQSVAKMQQLNSRNRRRLAR